MTLLLLLVAIGVLAVFVSRLNRASVQQAQDRITAAALAQAKEALIGYAVTQPVNGVYGYLPLPDMGSVLNGTPEEGNAAGNFAGNSKNLTVIGRLPWRTLKLPPLRDGHGECLWYAVSGSFQNAAPADVLNWDTLGHFDLHVSDGTALGTLSTTGSAFEKRPVAVVFSANALLASQNRAKDSPATDQVDLCGGNYDVRNYLDTYAGDARIQNILNYFTASAHHATGFAYGLNAASNGSQLDAAALAQPQRLIAGNVDTETSGLERIVNDQVLVITADDIFKRLRRRSDFSGQISGLLQELDLSGQAGTVAVSATAQGTDNLQCTNLSSAYQAFCQNWKEMLWLTQLPAPTPVTIDGLTTPACSRVLVFAGSRGAAQQRRTTAEKNTASNYLEEPNLSAFATPLAVSAGFSGSSSFSPQNPEADLLRCIQAGSSISFAGQLGQFTPTGTLVSNTGGVQTYSSGISVDTTLKTVSYDGVPGATTGACLWYPHAVQLAGKTLRAYYEYRMTHPDTYALSGSGSDRGNGFTFQMVRSDFGAPPNVCGSVTNMGVLSTGSGGWNSASILIETDIRRNFGHSDPAGNHTAILYGGNLTHSATNGNPTAACDGTAAGCRHTPANSFEESPTPLLHRQRLEIQSGCNAGCSSCNPASHVAPNTYVKINVWIDCANCADVAASFAGTPTIQRCVSLSSTLNSIYFGFTGGFLSGANTRQGVQLQNFYLKSE